LFAFPNKTEATTALNIIKQYGANQSCFIGRPNPSFQYLLINGRSPAGAATGEDCVSFDPEKIALNVLSDGRVQMISGSQSMFIFPDMLEAGNALSMIRKYGFTKTCFVGRPDASLQYMRKDSGATGTFELLPADAAVAAHERLNFTFTWFVPAPLVWRNLEHLQFRIREGEETILSVLFDEKSNAFVLLNETTGRPERGFLPGRPNRLESSQAALHLAETTVVGSGPTGQSVTLNLALSFKPQAAGRVFDVEVAASNDFGQRDEFIHAGWLTVKPAKTVLIDEPEAETEEVP
jgi:hypothetical protein